LAHELRRRNVSSAIEKSILTSLIVSTQFNYEVAHLINFDYFTNSFIRTVARWCIDFFDSYEKAPFNHIQDIFNERKSELKEVESDKFTVDKLVPTEYRRDIRPAMVKSLSGYLNSKEGLKQPLHVNNVKDKYRVVDGNHRMEAIKSYLKRNKDETLKIKLVIYDNLGTIEERKLFDMLAQTVNQSMNDYFKIHFDEVPLFGMIDDNFPYWY